MKQHQAKMDSFRVAVVFDPDKKPRAVWFDLDGKRVLIVSINYYWESHIGSAKIMHFAVSTNNRDQKWSIIYKTDYLVK